MNINEYIYQIQIKNKKEVQLKVDLNTFINLIVRLD
jgi:hypothetical protein